MLIKTGKLSISHLMLFLSVMAFLTVSCSSKVNVTLQTQIQNADPVGPNHKLMGTSGYEYPLLLIVPIEERENLSVRTGLLPGGGDSPLMVFIGDDDKDFNTVEVPPDGIIDAEIKIEPGTYILYAANFFQYDSHEFRAPIVLLNETDSGFAIAMMRVMGDEESSDETINLGITYLSQP
jgi:hypothetical protein